MLENAPRLAAETQNKRGSSVFVVGIVHATI